MVGPHPIAFASGRTNADAAAENRYLTTGMVSCEAGYGIDIQLLTAMTSADRVCMQSTALSSSALPNRVFENTY